MAAGRVTASLVEVGRVAEFNWYAKLSDTGLTEGPVCARACHAQTNSSAANTVVFMQRLVIPLYRQFGSET
jgi:hypothetical protein